MAATLIIFNFFKSTKKQTDEGNKKEKEKSKKQLCLEVRLKEEIDEDH